MKKQNIMVIGMPRAGAHALGQYLTKLNPDVSVITDEYTFLTNEIIKKNNLHIALRKNKVYIIYRKNKEAWENSFTALIGKPPHETQEHFVMRMKEFCNPIIIYLEDIIKRKDFPIVNKRNLDTHPLKPNETITTVLCNYPQDKIETLAYVHMKRKNKPDGAHIGTSKNL